MKPAQARILLTGAAGGIGREAAAAFSRAGAAVLLAGRTPARLSALARRLGAEPRVSWAAADLQDPAQIERLADTAAQWGCNVVVHAAGTPAFGALAAHDAQAMSAMMHTNLLAPMLLTRALLEHLRAQPRAQVMCVGSVLGRIGLPGFSLYCAAKFGLRGFAESLRRELAGSGVRVQYLGPRSTRTDFNDAQVQAYNRATGAATDEPGLVAAALLRMLEDERAERFLGFPEKLAVRINGLAPTLLDGSFRRHSASLQSPQPTPERITT
ncbi:SDR family oxidoreductase [Ramlibacter sp.]|uniref:SDR family oxidoreductase n=1 Tax=Ramlibacter sp. TaxID=1917967 RepID=UPI002C44741A|nr:SDR family oxidoreductase [Ramlibacter sp.]HWI83090.1 SDR family oxidoreductase [Ramlibacter sp.]